MDITHSERVFDDVRAELASDPRLAYPDQIAVEAFGDTVTLRGTVGSVARLLATAGSGSLIRATDGEAPQIV